MRRPRRGGRRPAPKQFHQIVVGRGRWSWDDEHRPFARTFSVAFDVNLAVREAADGGGRAEGNPQASRRRRQAGVGVAGEDHQAAMGHFCYLSAVRNDENIRRVIKTTRADPWSARRCMAGEGFEPSNAGIKTGAFNRLGDSPINLFAARRCCAGAIVTTRKADGERCCAFQTLQRGGQSFVMRSASSSEETSANTQAPEPAVARPVHAHPATRSHKTSGAATARSRLPGRFAWCLPGGPPF